MKITTGAGGGEFSGSIGSITAARGRYGIIFRNKTRPKNRATRRQQESRSIFSSLMNVWTETLTNENRESWRNWASQTPVDGKLLTGQLAFVRANIPRLPNNLFRVDQAPLQFQNGIPVISIQTTGPVRKNTIGITIIGANVLFSAILGGPTDKAGKVLVSLSRPINETIKLFKGPYQFSWIRSFPTSANTVLFAVPFTELSNDNGALVVGQTRAIRLQVSYNDGRLSLPYSTVALVVEA